MPPAVPDPYKALNLPHTATAAQIKKSYREMARKYHPDRLIIDDDGLVDDEEERARQRDIATSRFAAIASAYAILSDPQRKAQYDHVYKYGGYDDDDNDNDQLKEEAKTSGKNDDYRRASTATSASATPNRKRKSTGIGYTCVDPLAFLWTHGRVQAKMAVAGIQLPSRLHPTAPVGGSDGGPGGFRFAFSSAHLSSSPSGTTKVWQSKTTSYSQGQKFTRVETTTIYPDGRTETVVNHNPGEEEVDGDHNSNRRDGGLGLFASFGRDGANTTSSNDSHNAATTAARTTTASPWYAHAWSGIKDKIMMCYSPCTVTAVQ